MPYPQIEPKMFDYIYARVKDNPMYQQYVQTKDFRGVMVLAAQACVGIKELTGHNDGVLVNSIQRTVDGKVSADEYWCMDFIQTLRCFAEKVTGIKSPLKYTQGCSDLWQDTKAKHPELIVKTIPLPGAIMILKHKSGGGHTELVIASDGVLVYCIGGNTTGSLNPVQGVTGPVDRNGNGVYYTVRKMTDPELVGFIKPIAS